VFADARQTFARSALRALVANFSDPGVGAVSGELILLDEQGREAADGVGLYWRYEKWLRAMESGIHSMMGATGAIYAIRRDLYRPLPENTILDDVMTPMSIVIRGWRAVFDPSARAFDRVASAAAVEYTRKVRTLAGNYQLLALMPALLLPWRNPVAFQFVSHKAGRLLVPYCLAALLLSNLFLWHGVYPLFLAAQAGFYGTAMAGCLVARGAQKKLADGGSAAAPSPGAAAPSGSRAAPSPAERS
jgi:poly-beta-1,6-N-acetyl-D-glucosamine synthase